MAQHDGRVVSNFIVQALRGDDITLYGDGSQTRSFCYFSDLIRGLESLFFTEKIYVHVNLGNPQPRSIWEWAKEIIQMCESTSKIVFKPLPSDDPTQREPDISRAKAVLNWEPKVQRSQGLQETIEYFREVIQK
jgi:UDP-glucuronate decarboxylase